MHSFPTLRCESTTTITVLETFEYVRIHVNVTIRYLLLDLFNNELKISFTCY